MRLWLMMAAVAAAFALPRAHGAEEAAAPGAAYVIVDECGARFVELASDPDPRPAPWGVFGDAIDAYYGVAAYSHGQDGDPRRSDGSGRYQCTELVHRYLRDVFAVPSRLGLGLGNGVDLAQGVAERWGARAWTGGVTGATPITLRYYRAEATQCRPMVGAIVSIDMPFGAPVRPGHVAIIRSLRWNEGALEGLVFEQHGGADYAPQRIVPPGSVRFERDEAGVWRGAYMNDRGGAFPIVGWTNIVANGEVSVPGTGAVAED